MQILKVSLQNAKIAVKKTVQILKTGGVAVCPTDTVYGLIGDAMKIKAVEKI